MLNKNVKGSLIWSASITKKKKNVLWYLKNNMLACARGNEL